MTKEQCRKIGGGGAVVLLVLLPLWRELHEPGLTAWNVVLFLMLAALFVGAIVLHLHLHLHLLRNIDQVGEARFDTRNELDR